MPGETQFVELDGARIAYLDQAGDHAETLVLSHSLFFDKRMFAGQMSGLSDAFNIIAYDHRGHGESSKAADGRYDMDALYTDAAELITKLGRGPVHFAGNSMGGFVALRLAARRPDLVKSAIALGSSGDGEANKPQFAQLLAELAAHGGANLEEALSAVFFGQSSLADPDFATVRTPWIAHLRALDPFAAETGAGVVYRSRILDELTHCVVPVLAVAGAEDPVYPVPHSQAIADAAPLGEIVVIDKAGHSVALEQPEAVNTALRDFLSPRA